MNKQQYIKWAMELARQESDCKIPKEIEEGY